MQSPYFSPICTFILSSALASPAFSQSGTTDGTAQPPQAIPAAHASGSMNPSDDTTYATGKPLAGQSKEGFWGHVNPFARKKWVNRQVDPIKDRTNELDQLQSKNANDIRDVDARSQAGVSRAMTAANGADQHASDAQRRADAAQALASDASSKTTSLNATVSSLDQYQLVEAKPVTFVAGRTTLGPKAKTQLDEIAGKLANEKGYIIEVQGYSRSGVQTSQAMADSVARYFVTQYQVPIYRIYRTGLGKDKQKATGTDTPPVNGVLVSLLHNGLATMSSANGPAAPGDKALRAGASAGSNQ